MADTLLTPLEQYVIDQVTSMRKKHGYTQRVLAELLAVSEGFIGQIESTKENTKYNIEHLNQLAIIFKCSPKDFFPEKPLES